MQRHHVAGGQQFVHRHVGGVELGDQYGIARLAVAVGDGHPEGLGATGERGTDLAHAHHAEAGTLDA